MFVWARKQAWPAAASCAFEQNDRVGAQPKPPQRAQANAPLAGLLVLQDAVDLGVGLRQGRVRVGEDGLHACCYVLFLGVCGVLRGLQRRARAHNAVTHHFMLSHSRRRTGRLGVPVAVGSHFLFELRAREQISSTPRSVGDAKGAGGRLVSSRGVLLDV